MKTLLTTSLVGFAVVVVVSTAVSWRKHYITAKSSRLPVFLSPVHIRDLWWLVLYPLLVPILSVLPARITSPWLSLAQAWRVWRYGYEPFREAGSDTIILCTPRGNILWTCDPQMANQIYMHPQSQIAIDMVDFFDVYGPTIASIEGTEWKRHRRIVTLGFNSATYSAVWKETIEQTRGLVACLNTNMNSVFPATKEWTIRLALHVICAALFHTKLPWTSIDDRKNVTTGYRLPFEEAIFTVLAQIGTLYVVPRAILPYLPFQKFRGTNLAFKEWTKYMRELRGDALSRLNQIAKKTNKSMLETIVLAGSTASNDDEHPFSEDEVFGNLFFTVLAGHETVGNTMAFAFDLLALYPEYQQKMFEELTGLLEKRGLDEWTVEHEYQILSLGWVGSVLKEVQRLYSAVVFNPRLLTAPAAVTDSDGLGYSIPANTLCIMNFGATFRNPKIWSQNDIPADRRKALHNSPALDFDPSRWMRKGGPTGMTEVDENFTAPLHFPYAQGRRICPGRIFAQIEMIATIATLCLGHTLELVVEPETLRSCAGDAKAALEETRDRAFRTLVDDVEANITLQLHKPLAIRVVERA